MTLSFFSRKVLATDGEWNEMQKGQPVPERQLLAAIVFRALLDLGAKKYQDRQSAKKWLMSENERAFSFKWICKELYADAEAVRQKTQELLKKGTKIQRRHLLRQWRTDV